MWQPRPDRPVIFEIVALAGEDDDLSGREALADFDDVSSPAADRGEVVVREYPCAKRLCRHEFILQDALAQSGKKTVRTSSVPW